MIADQVLDRRAADQPATRAAIGGCPYKGLLRFEPEDAGWFFGRERMVAELLAAVASTRCTGVVGASGSGKSSLTRAGLLAALGEDALPGSAQWPRLLVTPGADPLLELARALAPVSHASSANEVRDRLLEDPASLAGFAERASSRLNGGNSNASVIIVVDQLEEVFTVCRDESVRARFFDVLVRAASDPDSPTKVLAAIRSDYYGRCAEHAGFGELLGQSNLLVGPMRPDELQRAIEEPARRAGLDARGRPGRPHLRRRRRRARVAPALADRVARDVEPAEREHVDARGLRGVRRSARRSRAPCRRRVRASVVLGAGHRTGDLPAARRTRCANRRRPAARPARRADCRRRSRRGAGGAGRPPPGGHR